MVSAAAVVPEFSLAPNGSVDEGALRAFQSATVGRFAQASGAGIAVDVLVDVGSPAGCIVERAGALPADLVVMGTHRVSGFQHLMLGSVTERVIRKAACPVLTVPPRAHATSRLPFNRLLCAIDFSESSMVALRFAVSLAKESGPALTMLDVLEWPWEEPPAARLEELPAEQAAALANYRRHREEVALKRLDALASTTRLSPLPAVRLRNGKPHVQILDVTGGGKRRDRHRGARQKPARHDGVGSTTNQVVRAAACPVLTLRH